MIDCVQIITPMSICGRYDDAFGVVAIVSHCCSPSNGKFILQFELVKAMSSCIYT